ncbi:hypothetical protein [Pararobbsia alpina]|uniref:hypothetical protein n=1 Tax=Pararobbsia alpina TaxID=621374 RepID=UPI001FE81C71|nr:hypothetical protein [Pararobbsia alpina]
MISRYRPRQMAPAVFADGTDVEEVWGPAATLGKPARDTVMVAPRRGRRDGQRSARSAPKAAASALADSRGSFSPLASSNPRRAQPAVPSSSSAT